LQGRWVMDTREISAYNTWYEFKKELHRRSGLLLLNRLWLQIKPRDPLPWHEFQMRQSLSLLSNRILRMRNCPRCGGNLVTDRDVDGYNKRCIQCSFAVEIIPPKSLRPLSRMEPLESRTRDSVMT
jgi:hypothetical protein